MPRKNINFYLLICVVYFCSACADKKSNRPENPVQQDTWNSFIQAVESADKRQFEVLATRTLNCLPCLDNSIEERQQLSSASSKDSKGHLQWVAMNKFVYTKAFLDRDYAIFFTPEFVRQLENTKVKFLTVDTKNFEVRLINSDAESNQKQQQYAFGFTKEDKEYKLNKINILQVP